MKVYKNLNAQVLSQEFSRKISTFFTNSPETSLKSLQNKEVETSDKLWIKQFLRIFQCFKDLHRHEYNPEIVHSFDSIVNKLTHDRKVVPKPNNLSHGEPSTIRLQHCHSLEQSIHQLQMRMCWNVEDPHKR